MAPPSSLAMTATVSLECEPKGGLGQPWVRCRMQLLAALIITLGAASIFVEGATLGEYSLANGRDVVRGSVAFFQSTWRGGDSVSAWGAESATTERTTANNRATPPPVFKSPRDRTCYYQRDLGLIDQISQSTKVFCPDAQSDNNKATTRRTKVSLVELPQDQGITLRAMLFEKDLTLDFRKASIHQPIATLSQDGGNHDPRFHFDASIVSCGCDELQQYAMESYLASKNTTRLRLWDEQLPGSPSWTDAPSTVCTAVEKQAGDSAGTAESVDGVSISSAVQRIHDKTILITRRDDHNPFFQVSNALNAWLMMKSLGWERDEVRVVHMDGGYASPIDQLHHRLLSSPGKFEILRGRQNLLGFSFQFTNQVLVAPYEATGPMMVHLDDDEPCHKSQLFQEFRQEALQAMGVAVNDTNTATATGITTTNRSTTAQPEQITTVTIITRRDYQGRRVQRRWLNEDQVVEAMRKKYKAKAKDVVLQSVDFVNLTLAQQMDIALHSGVIIGMHGAGMVNVLWTKPGTLVIEIFPKNRHRWGYRNLCQYVGCEWHEFRGGVDTGKGDNASDKTIPVDDWVAFFDPLLQLHRQKMRRANIT